MTMLAVQPAESAVSRAFAVLETLAASPEPMRLSAIALRLGMQKSTTHRILTALAQRGYAEQVEATSCYRATLKMWEMGAGVIAEHPIKRAASAFLQALHRATGETVSLTILSGDDVLYLDKIISPRPVRFTTRVGSRVPAPLTAGGKAMLAHAPDARAMARRAAGRIKDKRRVDLETLMKELEKVRAQGYATSSFSPGVISFAAPVMARDGRAPAALSVSAPLDRVGARKRGEIIEQVMTACVNMAERVGDL
jgi:DNA-binding IclR family transcriptional regulator